MVPSASSTSFQDDVLVVRRRKLVTAFALAPLVLGLALSSSGSPSVVALGLALAWVGVGTTAYALARDPVADERPSRVWVDRGGLYVDGRLFASMKALRGGWVVPRSHAPPLVHLRRAGGFRVSLVMRDAEQARELLRTLSADPSQVTAQFWAMARPFGEPRVYGRSALLVALSVGLGAATGNATPAALAVAVLGLVVLFFSLATPTRVVVGADGVLLRWLGTVRFVGWSRVGAIERFDGGVVLGLEEGGWVTLRMPADAERHNPEGDAMVERMRMAWLTHQTQRGEDTVARLVRRAGNRTREWVRAMRALPLPPADYRTARVLEQQLWRVAEDPRIDREARTGAALALVSRLDDSGRRRLRFAAAACAEPGLRSMLIAICTRARAALSDEDLAATLDAIDAESLEREAQDGLAP